MTRLPKRYFKSISDYVRTYYTAYGAQRAQKLYDAVKTVTKDFTRTDPVYVRIGEDGEPEIHYTMTQANGVSYFEKMDLGKATLYIHNGKILTGTIYGIFYYSSVRKVVLDSWGSVTDIGSLLQYCQTIEEFDAPDYKGFTACFASFMQCWKLKAVPAFDCANLKFSTYDFYGSGSIEEFHPYGMVTSLDLHFTALKHDAILEVFNNLGEVDKTAGITLTLGSVKLALMSDEEKAIATGKGWVLA